jgi:hypothetical protein
MAMGEGNRSVAPSRELPSVQQLNDLLSLLSEGLDLCVRARKLDDAVSKAALAGGVGALERPHGGAGSRCLSPAIWVQDAYDRDLADWEQRARAGLERLLPFVTHLPAPSATTALLKALQAQASESPARDGASPQNTGDPT